MPIQIAHDSELGKELWKWNHKQGEYYESTGGEIDRTIEGKRPRQPQEFPMMIYMARPNQGGKTVCIEPQPSSMYYPDMGAYERACLAVESFNRQNQKIVHSPEELDREIKRGWRDSPDAALAYYEALQIDISNAAAEANASVSRMSQKAKDEFQAAGESTDKHVTDLKGTRKRGRPAKAAPMPISGTTEIGE